MIDGSKSLNILHKLKFSVMLQDYLALVVAVNYITEYLLEIVIDIITIPWHENISIKYIRLTNCCEAQVGSKRKCGKSKYVANKKINVVRSQHAAIPPE